MSVFVELVHSVIPDLTDEDADHVLWEHTPFPFCNPDDLLPFIVAHHGDVVARSTHLGALT